MLRKVGLVSALLLAIPAFANAWTVTAKIGSGQGTVVSGVKTIAKPGTYVGYFKVANEPLVADQTFTVDPADGFSLSSVIVNGTNVTATGVAAAGDAVDFTVASGTPIKNSQSLVVYFKQNLYGVSVSQATGGKVTVQRCNAAGTETYGSLSLSTLSNLKPGSYVKVTAMPNADFKVSSIDGSAVTGLRGEIKSSVIQLGAASESVDALFTQVATVTPVISVYPAIANPGATVTVDASKTLSNVSGVTYDFTTNAPGVTFAQSGAVATTSFPTEGNYTITVTANATAGGATTFVSASWPVEVKINNACLTCHNNRNPAVITAWKAGAHGTTASNCESCHKDTHGTVRSDITLGVGAPSIGAGNYVGSGVCASCHADKYETFKLSGHNFKINKVVNNEMPTFPFSSIAGALENMPATTTLNTLGKPTSYEQVSYVVGGYAWKARWIDRAGYIVSSTTQGVQYNLAYPATQAQGWSTYGAVQKKYTCGECHTTGWKYYAGTDAAQKQDGLSGMPGTWAQAGVQCEACHGPGKEHALTPATTNITKVATGRTQAQMQVETGYGNPVNCGECHTRDGERNPYGGEGAATDGTFRSAYNVASGTSDIIGGRIRASSLNNPIGGHHQTGDEMFGVDPDNLAAGPMGKHRLAGMTCGTCHDPHRTTFYQNRLGNGAGVDVACTSCHEVTFTATGAAHSNADCITCHMPKLAKSAVSTGPNAAGKTLGDIKTHVFKIDLDATTNVAAANGGKFLKPFITADYSCGACHSAPGTKVTNLKTSYGGKIHGAIRFKHDKTAGLQPTGASCVGCHTTGTTAVAAKVDIYAGSATCGTCHTAQYATFVQSGHPYKLNKVVNNTQPTYPFSNIDGKLQMVADVAAGTDTNGNLTDNASGEPRESFADATYADVSYVIGGFGWKARWIDNKGYVITGSKTQVNLTKSYLPAGSWSSYNDNKVTKYDINCTYCHVTGARQGSRGAKVGTFAEDFNPTMPGFDGDGFAFGGIQCESCHGSGLNHVKNGGTVADIKKHATPRPKADLIADNGYGDAVACGECHTRDNERMAKYGFMSYFEKYRYPEELAAMANFPGGTAMTGLIISNSHGRTSHHEVNEELQGIDPLNVAQGPKGKHAHLKCYDCHKPHQTLVYAADKGDAMKQACLNCHAEKATQFGTAVAAMMGAAGAPSCLDCHMPNLVQNAVTVTQNGWTFGDNRSHSMKIDLTKSAAAGQQNLQIVDADGVSRWYAYPLITREYACRSCHTADHVADWSTFKVHQ